MDFNDTPEEAAYRAKARAWLDTNAKLRDPDASARGMLGEGDSPEVIAEAKAWQATKAAAGWACLRWPKEYGGQEATAIQSVIFNQEQARFETPPDIYGIGHGMLGPTIMAHGTEEQKKRFLPKMVEGSEVWCCLLYTSDAADE